jgi:SSS family solute:Na+ symporter
MLERPDWIIIAAYFLAVFGVAVWASFRAKADSSSAGYFLAGRNAGWFVIGGSLFASNIGSEHLVGLAGTGAHSGVAVGQFEVLASLILLCLGWVFVPFYLRSGVYTMPEFLERRYSPAARWYLAVVSIIGYVLTKVSVTIAAGGIVFNKLMGVDFWKGALIVVLATGLYTVLGGLRAVLYTDLLQMFVLIGGAVTVTLMGLSQLGGWGEMKALAGPEFLSMWKPWDHPDFPWTGILLGAPILGVWYWCTDQFIVQRVLSARDIRQARLGAIFGGYLKLLPVFIFVVPGIIAYCLAKSGKLHLGTSDEALPALVGAILPVGVRGLVVAGLLAALMSSLSSVFNSCSTLITWDIYKKIHPEASERRLVVIGQLCTLVIVALGLAWIPLMSHVSATLYTYLQSVQAYISPPVAAVFLLGVFWRRVNAAGAMAALIGGFILGAVRLVAELNKARLGDGLLFQYADMNFLHFAVLLFVVCCVLLVLVSLATPPMSDRALAGLTYATASQEATLTDAGAIPPAEAGGRSLQIGLSLVLAAGVGLTWWYFS